MPNFLANPMPSITPIQNGGAGQGRWDGGGSSSLSRRPGGRSHMQVLYILSYSTVYPTKVH